MMTESFKLSIFNKFNKFFLGKNLKSVVLIKDVESNLLLKHINYLELGNNNYIGIFINSGNPLFVETFFNELDTFNLYENYQELGIIVQKSDIFKIQIIKLVFSAEYNQLLGFYLTNSKGQFSFSAIFCEDYIINLKNISFMSFYEFLKKELLHVDKLLIYERHTLKNFSKIEFSALPLG